MEVQKPNCGHAICGQRNRDSGFGSDRQLSVMALRQVHVPGTPKSNNSTRQFDTACGTNEFLEKDDSAIAVVGGFDADDRYTRAIGSNQVSEARERS